MIPVRCRPFGPPRGGKPVVYKRENTCNFLVATTCGKVRLPVLCGFLRRGAGGIPNKGVDEGPDCGIVTFRSCPGQARSRPGKGGENRRFGRNGKLQNC